jgi:hypothetical protein
MSPLVVRLITLLVTALSLGLSFAHVLESPPRLSKWSPELWREATVFNGQYLLFGTLGGPLDVAAVLATAVLAVVVRSDQPAFRYALAGAIFFALALVAWAAIVAPANAVLATWQPGPLPENFYAVRNRWEIGHMICAGLKLCGFVAVTISALLFHGRTL